jgi:hypothetical protein
LEGLTIYFRRAADDNDAAYFRLQAEDQLKLAAGLRRCATPLKTAKLIGANFFSVKPATMMASRKQSRQQFGGVPRFPKTKITRSGGFSAYFPSKYSIKIR